jgi:hypothetical protein
LRDPQFRKTSAESTFLTGLYWRRVFNSPLSAKQSPMFVLLLKSRENPRGTVVLKWLEMGTDIRFGTI